MRKISHLELFNIETGERKILHTFEGLIEAPNFLKDGHTLLFNAGGRLYFYDRITEKCSRIPLPEEFICNNDHVLSPDEEEIGFSAELGEGKDWCSYIWTFSLKKKEVRRITEHTPSYLHGWSGDGHSLCYCAFRNDRIEICTIPAGGGEEQILTDGIGYNDGPEYSPDDQYIWFNSTRDGLMQIYRMKKDGSEMKCMAEDEANLWFPHVSPDGKKVVYLAFSKNDLEPWQHLPDKNVSLYLMNSDGSDRKEILKLFGGQGTINVNSWSADSKSFAFVSYEYV